MIILLKGFYLILTALGLFYPAILMYKSSKSLKTSSLVFVIGFFLYFSFTPITIILGALSFIQIVFMIALNKELFKRKEKPTYITNTNRSNEKLYLESDLGTIEVSNPYRSILVSGGAGAGKSKSVFYPFIRQFMQNEYAGVLYDFKSPELSEFAYSKFKKNENSKIQFKVIDFKSPSKSNRCNPLSPRYITKQAVAIEMATVLINNLLPESVKKRDFFTRSSISILAGSIWFLVKNFPNQSTLPHLISMVLEYPSSKLIEVVCSDKECAGMLSSIREAHEMKAEKQIAAVVGTLKMALSQINIPEVFELMSADEVNLDLNNPEDPTFLCIGNDSTLSSTYGPVISLIIACCIRQMNQPNKNPSVIMLDELPTVYIGGLEQLPATARSNKISTVLGFQDLSQLIDAYGNDKAQVLLSNAGNQFFGRSTNEKTAQMLTKLSGKHDVLYTSKSKGDNYGESSNSSSEGTTQSYQQRDRITTSDILQLKPGEFVSMVADNQILPFFKIVRFSQLIDIEYKSLPEIARVENKSIEQFSSEIENLSLTEKQPELLLDSDEELKNSLGNNDFDFNL